MSELLMRKSIFVAYLRYVAFGVYSIQLTSNLYVCRRLVRSADPASIGDDFRQGTRSEWGRPPRPHEGDQQQAQRGAHRGS
jgi:hypothetical protein